MLSILSRAMRFGSCERPTPQAASRRRRSAFSPAHRSSSTTGNRRMRPRLMHRTSAWTYRSKLSTLMPSAAAARAKLHRRKRRDPRGRNPVAAKFNPSNGREGVVHQCAKSRATVVELRSRYRGASNPSTPGVWSHVAHLAAGVQHVAIGLPAAAVSVVILLAAVRGSWMAGDARTGHRDGPGSKASSSRARGLGGGVQALRRHREPIAAWRRKETLELVVFIARPARHGVGHRCVERASTSVLDPG